MATTLAFRFPLGRYHANPWDRAVNEGASEWPPSPWRILRALIATWHTRWPDLPAAEIEGLLDALGDPPSYKTPPARTGHTRHYLPDLSHRKAEAGHTDLTLDPFLTLARDAELKVRWDADLTEAQRATLAKLAELIPYLGRSESACHARLVGTDERDEDPDETWWRPDTEGGSVRTRLLAPRRPVSRTAMEATTGGVRRQRRTVPPGTRWVTYSTADPAPETTTPPPSRKRRPELRNAIRFAVIGAAPVRITHGVLVADQAHRKAGRLLEKAHIPDDRRKEIMGTGGAASDHRHAHWIPVGEPGESAAYVRNLLLYVPGGLEPAEIGATLDLGELSGKLGGDDGYEVRGFPAVRLLFQAAGQIADVAPELCARPRARRWRSVTPYLPVRHRHPNRETREEFLAADVAFELRNRGLPAPASVTAAEPAAGRVNQFRRYRMKEKLVRSRPGTGLVIELESPVEGPLLLGQLSHFGFGVFTPEP